MSRARIVAFNSCRDFMAIAAMKANDIAISLMTILFMVNFLIKFVFSLYRYPCIPIIQPKRQIILTNFLLPPELKSC